MKRRNFILGLGSLTGVGSLVFGTGAFTSVAADRQLTAQVADDNDALLGLHQLGEGERSDEDGTPEQVEFSFPGDEERLADPNLGLGTDSVYEFDRDAAESSKSSPTEGLLRITNQGTQTVEVYSQFQSTSNLEVELYDVTDTEEVALRDDPAELDVGEHVDVGFRIRTFGTPVGTFDETLTIVAEAPDS